MHCVKTPHYEILSLKTWWEPIIVMFPPSNGYTINGIYPVMSNYRSFFTYPMPILLLYPKHTGMLHSIYQYWYGVGKTSIL